MLAALAAGLLVSIFQAVTQINEATLVFLPKVAAMFAVLMILGGSMFVALDGFAHFIFSQIILAGVLLCLIAVAVNGAAGLSKEREVTPEEKAEAAHRQAILHAHPRMTLECRAFEIGRG